MLQAIIQSVEFIDASQVRVVAVVTDGQTKAVQEVITSSLVNLKARLRGLVNEVESAKELAALQPNDVIDLAAETVTPEEQARRDFIEGFARLESAQRKVAVGLIKSDDADLLALAKDVQALYKPEFVGIG